MKRLRNEDAVIEWEDVKQEAQNLYCFCQDRNIDITFEAALGRITNAFFCGSFVTNKDGSINIQVSCRKPFTLREHTYTLGISLSSTNQ